MFSPVHRAFAALHDYRGTFEQLVRLGAPVSASSVTRSLMGATDAAVAAAISPSAVAVVTIADLYRQLVGRFGGGIGGGAIALTSQDTGAGATANRDEAVSQATLLAVVIALPVAVASVVFGEPLISVVGGGNLDSAAVSDGAAYLAVTLVVAPITLPKAVFAQAFSAIGDTKTPFYVGAAGDVLNVALSLALGFGFAPLGVPKLGVVGLGIATAVASVLSTFAFLVLLIRNSPYSLVTPTDPTIGKQVLRVGLPQAASGFVTSVAVFPFSRILVGFGTNVYAGYQVAWRLYGLTVGVITPGLAVATKILVGQAVGDRAYDEARTTVRAALVASTVVAGTVGLVIALLAEPLAGLLFADQNANQWTGTFGRLLGAVAVLGVGNNVVASALQGASETRVDLLSRIAGMFGGMVGVTWLLGVYYDWGVTGAYVGIVACYVLFVAVTAAGYLQTDWESRAEEMLTERGSVSAES